MGFLSLLRRFYLAVYNWTVFIGWSQVLYFAVKTLKGVGHEQVYYAVERPLLLAQTAAILEILHSLVGLVNSPVSVTLLQISSRMYVTWAILWNISEIQNHALVSFTALSWSITETVRHSFFGMKEAIGFTPYWHLWLRYSTFFLCQPTGIISEIGLIYSAMPFMKESGNHCKWMPNKIQFYVAIIMVGIYLPGSLRVHWHLHMQRKKALSKSKRD